MKATELRAIMSLAWQFVKRNGFTMAKALRTAWQNFKLRRRMLAGIVKFYYQKVSGEVREAYGTLRGDMLPAVAETSTRRQNPTVQTYYDTERCEWRCFKVANLVRIA